jgi:hypothetical protein
MKPKLFLPLLAPFFSLLLQGMLPASGENGDSDEFVVVKGARIITVTGDEIEKGTIVIKNGVIEAVGENVEIPFPARVIDADGLWVMPGLVNPCSLAGYRALRRSGIQAHLKVADEFDADEDALEDLALCGFTAFGFRPNGGTIPGTAMAARPQPDAGTKALNDSAYVFIEADSPSRDKKAVKDAFVKAKQEIEKQEKARKDWEEKQKKAAEEAAKKAEAEKKKAEEAKKEGEQKKEPPKEGPEKKDGKKEPEKFTPPPISPPYVPLVELIQKKEGMKALVAFGQASDLLHFDEAVEDFEFARSFVLRNRAYGSYGDSDLYLAAEELGEAGAEVVIYPVINTRPLTRNRYNLACILADAGCKVSLRPVDDSLRSHAEFLRSVAGLIAAGLDRETALKAVTLHPAELLGIAGRVGAIEKGRDADLLFLTGDPFSLGTRVDRVMMKGAIVEGRHEIQ